MQNRHPVVWTGGDQIQLEALQAGLAELGVTVDFSPELKPDLRSYDLVHLFNLSAPWTYLQCLNACRQEKPVVISTIYQEKDSSVPYRAQQRVVNYAVKLILNSPGEVARAKQRLVVNAHKVVIVPMGVDQAFRGNDVEPFTLPSGEDYVLCVGRINDKNQLRLTVVCKQLGVPLVLVGEMRHPSFRVALANIGYPQCLYLGPQTKADLIPIYKGAKVVACPSPTEIFPSVVLEGGLAGCNIVLTSGSASMKDWPNVAVCDPDNPQSIADAVARQIAKPQDGALVDKILGYTWDGATRRLKNVYDGALSTSPEMPLDEGDICHSNPFSGFSCDQEQSTLYLSALLPAWRYLELDDTPSAQVCFAQYARTGIADHRLREIFVNCLVEHACLLGLPPGTAEAGRAFVEAALAGLPPTLSQLSGVKGNSLAKFWVTHAFQTRGDGPSFRAMKSICRAAVRDRSWLRDQSQISMALQAVLGRRISVIGRTINRRLLGRSHRSPARKA